MEFTVDMFLRQRWNDPRLAFGEKLLNTASNIDTLRTVQDLNFIPRGLLLAWLFPDFIFEKENTVGAR